MMRMVCEMFRLKGCVSCGGDLGLNYGDWQCLQCGRYYYISVPWSSPSRREGGWGNAGKVSKQGGESKKRRRENEPQKSVVAA